MTYLYLKTHNKTGLKYLGKTISKDPHEYEGSGKVWRRHLEVHGYDVKTEILLETDDLEELKEWGLYYSNLWDVTHSKEFANLMPESGDGGDTFSNNPRKEEIREILRLKSTGSKRTDETKLLMKNTINSQDRAYSGRNKKSMNTFSGRTHSEETKAKIRQTNKRRSPNSRKDKIPSHSYNKGIPKSEEHKKKLSEANKGRKPFNSRIIVVGDKEFVGMKDAAKYLEIPYSTLRNRLGSCNIHFAHIYDKANPKILIEGIVKFGIDRN